MPLSTESAVVFLAILVFVLSSVEQGQFAHFFIARSHSSLFSMCLSCCPFETLEASRHSFAMRDRPYVAFFLQQFFGT